VELLADLCAAIAIGEEFVLVDDRGGVYTDEGQYHSYLQKLIETLKGASRPFLGFAQTRMMPLEYREENKASFHLFPNPMTSAQISQLTSFRLREIGVDYSAGQIADICALLDGNPINVKLAMKAIHSYGLSQFIADPSLLVAWKRRRAEDFLSKFEFTNVETQLMAILFDYRFVIWYRSIAKNTERLLPYLKQQQWHRSSVANQTFLFPATFSRLTTSLWHKERIMRIGESMQLSSVSSRGSVNIIFQWKAGLKFFEFGVCRRLAFAMKKAYISRLRN
jgi:hypothetical protein